MLLTPVERDVFHFHNRLFCYIWPLVVKWDSEYSKVVFRKSTVTVLPNILMTLFITLFGLFHLFVTLDFELFFPTQKYKRIHKFIFLLTFIITFSVCLGFFILCKRRVLASFNELLRLSSKLDYEFTRKKWTVESKSLQNYAPFALIPFAGLVPYLIGLGALIADLDIVNFVLERFATQAEYRSISTILSLMLYRFLVNTLVSLEIARSVSFLYCLAVVLISRFVNIVTIFEKKVRSISRFVLYYNRFRIIFTTIQDIANTAVYIFLNAVFWITVCTFWAIVRSSVDELSLPVYSTILGGYFVLVGGLLFLLPTLCTAIDLVAFIIKRHYFRGKLKCAGWKTQGNKIDVLRVQSLRPLVIMFGPYWRLGKTFVITFIGLTCLRSFDAILLFHD